MRKPIEVYAELFSLQESDALTMWWELVERIGYYRLRGEQGPVASRALKEIAKQYGLYFLNLDSRMKAAILPMILAEDEALAYVGLHPKKRTACGLAEAAAVPYLEWMQWVYDDAKTRYEVAQKAAETGGN